MARLTQVFIILTYVLGAAVAAGALMRFAAAEPLTAWAVAGLAALGAVQAHAAIARRSADQHTARTLEALRQANLAMLEEMAAARTRLGAMQAQLAGEQNRAQQDLREEMERLDRALRGVARRQDVAQIRQDEEHAVAGPLERASPQDIREALAAEGVEVLLQPILTLPQRRTVSYEAFAQLRLGPDRLAPPGAWLGAAAAAGLTPHIDIAMLSRCVRAARSLAAEGRPMALFCNVSPQSFDGAAFQRVFDVLRASTDVAPLIVLEMAQADFQGLGVIALRNLMRVTDFGYRVSLDHLEDLDLDFDRLRRVNVRFVKIDGRRLIAALQGGGRLGVAAAPDIAAADYAKLLERRGIQTVIEKIEDEQTVIEALEFEVRLGQGRLFGEPRPVRAALLRDDAPPVSQTPLEASLEDEPEDEARASPGAHAA